MTSRLGFPAVTSPALPPPILPPGISYARDGFQIRVSETLNMTGNGRETAEAVRFLRECQSHALQVNWIAVAENRTQVDFRLLWHLPAALSGSDGVELDDLAGWRERHAYGLFYYRQGPGFITVKDCRTPGETNRYTLEHPDLLAVFVRCLEPMPWGAFGSAEREAVELLEEERVMLVSGDWVVTLPPRLRHWPVPAEAI
ncbi:DUF5825 family protein [Streptomyces sp. NPDC007983]|uniref:DUF5825 family protein n=1 Tax=Streptomyces sp. NPDC007983 TaxID=3364800 RepID=UPI0036EFF0F9